MVYPYDFHEIYLFYGYTGIPHFRTQPSFPCFISRQTWLQTTWQERQERRSTGFGLCPDIPRHKLHVALLAGRKIWGPAMSTPFQ